MPPLIKMASNALCERRYGPTCLLISVGRLHCAGKRHVVHKQNTKKKQNQKIPKKKTDMPTNVPTYLYIRHDDSILFLSPIVVVLHLYLRLRGTCVMLLLLLYLFIYFIRFEQKTKHLFVYC